MATRTKRMIAFLIILAVILGAAAIWYFLRAEPAETAESGEEQILTLEVAQGTVAVRVEGPSVVEPFRSQDVRSQTSGPILSAPEEGDAFAAGDTIIKIDSTEQLNAVKQAELNLAQAKIDLGKAQLAVENAKKDLAEKELQYKSGAVAQEQVNSAKEAVATGDLALSSAELKVGQSELSLEKAKAELQNTVITVPFSGIVLKSLVGIGDVVNSGAILLTFADVSKVRLQAEVDEFDIAGEDADECA